MGLLFNVASRSAPPPQADNTQPRSPGLLGMLGTVADIGLTGGLFHALNQRAQAEAMRRAQAQDYRQLGAMFTPGETTSAPAAPVPGATSGVDLFAGGKFGAAPDQTFGGDSVQVTPPGSPSMEQFAPAAARAFAQHGTDVGPLLELLKASEPNIQFVNGQGVDTKDRGNIGRRVGVSLSNVNNRMVDTENPDNANLTVPQVDKGQVVSYDARGVPMGVSNLPGNAAAQGEVAGAVSDAQEKAKAGLDLVEVPTPNGGSVKLPRLQAARILGGGAGAGPLPLRGGAPGLGVSQAPNDKTYGDEQAKAAAGRYAQIQTAGSQAPAKIAQYQQLGRLFDGVNGNRLSPTGLEVSRLGKSMGFSVDPKLGNKEAGVALANQIALTLRDPSSGGGMPGSMSNSDRQFLTNMVPNLAQSDAGRKQLVDIYVAKAGRDQDTAKLARQWQQRYGRIDSPDANGLTFEDQLQKWSEMHPLFGKH